MILSRPRKLYPGRANLAVPALCSLGRRQPPGRTGASIVHRQFTTQAGRPRKTHSERPQTLRPRRPGLYPFAGRIESRAQLARRLLAPAHAVGDARALEGVAADFERGEPREARADAGDPFAVADVVLRHRARPLP